MNFLYHDYSFKAHAPPPPSPPGESLCTLLALKYIIDTALDIGQIRPAKQVIIAKIVFKFRSYIIANNMNYIVFSPIAWFIMIILGDFPQSAD